MRSSPHALARLAASALARAGLALPGTGKGCHGDSPWESRAILDLSGTGQSPEPAHRKGWAFSKDRPWMANQVGIHAGRVQRHALCPLCPAECCCQESIWGAGKTALASPLFSAVTSKWEELALPSLAQLPCAKAPVCPIPSCQS